MDYNYILSLGNQPAGNVVMIRKTLDRMFYQGRRSATFVIVGKTGVGKSRLVNALLGLHGKAAEGYSLDPQTMNVSQYTTIKHGVEIVVWDSPGLEDGSGNEDIYLEQISSSATNIDLLVFCAPMNDKRIRPEDLSTVEKITKTLGANVWKQAIIALTFANEVKPQSNFKGSHKEFFETKLSQFSKKYGETLTQKGVHSTVPCMPVGDIGKPVLPIYKNWLSAFWLLALRRIDDEAKTAMLQASHNRISFTSKRINETDCEEDSAKKTQDESVVRRPPKISNSTAQNRPRSEYGDIVELSQEQEEELHHILLTLAKKYEDKRDL